MVLKVARQSLLLTLTTSTNKDRKYFRHSPELRLTSGSTGWAALSVDNAGCSTSTVQSPIDITSASSKQVAAGTVQMNFPAVASAEFENIGSTIEVVMKGKNASTTVNGKQ